MVGKALQDSAVNVGAVNCLKHGDLCRTLSIHRYPTLIALNPPGQPQGTSADPAIKTIEKTSNYEGIVDAIKLEFPDAVDPAAVAHVAAAKVLEQEEAASGKMQETENETGMGEGGGAPCILRIEDAVASVRFCLKNELFTGGHYLSDDRKGECACHTSVVLGTPLGAPFHLYLGFARAYEWCAVPSRIRSASVPARFLLTLFRVTPS